MEIVSISYVALERRLLCLCGTNDRRSNKDVLGSPVEEGPAQCGISLLLQPADPRWLFSLPQGVCAHMYMVHHLAAFS